MIFYHILRSYVLSFNTVTLFYLKLSTFCDVYKRLFVYLYYMVTLILLYDFSSGDEKKTGDRRLVNNSYVSKNGEKCGLCMYNMQNIFALPSLGRLRFADFCFYAQ